MVHQANKPVKISQALNLFCSRQGPLCMEEASGFWSKFIRSGDTLHYAVHCSPDVVHSELQCDLLTKGSIIAHSGVCPDSSHSAVQRQRWGQHVTHRLHSTCRNIKWLQKPGFWEQSMNISGNQVPKDFQRRTKPHYSSQGQMTPEWSQLSNFSPPL